jgi:hypothetical protein
MEEITWEKQAHFRYDVECNIQGVSQMFGYNFKSKFSTPEQKEKLISKYVRK